MMLLVTNLLKVLQSMYFKAILNLEITGDLLN